MEPNTTGQGISVFAWYELAAAAVALLGGIRLLLIGLHRRLSDQDRVLKRLETGMAGLACKQPTWDGHERRSPPGCPEDTPRSPVVPVSRAPLWGALPQGTRGAGLVLAIAIMSATGCTATQQAIIRPAVPDLAQCFWRCGARAADLSVQQLDDGMQFDGKAIGLDVLTCALPCLWKFGTVVISAAASPPGRYFGSSSEAIIYQPDLIRVTVKYPTSD